MYLYFYALVIGLTLVFGAYGTYDHIAFITFIVYLVVLPMFFTYILVVMIIISRLSVVLCNLKGSRKISFGFIFLGPHVWSLPAALLVSPDSTDKFRWFARFLLEGQVLSSLKEFATHLVTPALVMTASWSQ